MIQHTYTLPFVELYIKHWYYCRKVLTVIQKANTNKTQKKIDMATDTVLITNDLEQKQVLTLLITGLGHLFVIEPPVHFSFTLQVWLISHQRHCQAAGATMHMLQSLR